MKIVSVVLVLMLFGTVCSSYAIDCMDVWDEESIAEMIEDDRQYEESLKAGHDHHEEDDDDDEHPVDNEDAILGDTDEDDEDGGDHQAHEHHGSHVRHGASEHRHKRESPVDDQPGVQGEAINEEPSDLETAETHLFRPVFRYKSQYAERRRVRTSNGGVNFVPSQ
ncbi:uncharacterized protein LOC126563473 [Anopheles maculipalpis]|uniref:uncharacterized protein LOC126563473 n=1 Tax=Anopheles maculipalpis TaxID=1496333 RepID=UPI0021592A91|nr:uncharacterized protein LOC126563473 [Anopheles maculipalpis]